MHARIEPAPDGGSLIIGTIGTSRWVNVFMLVLLIGAVSLASLLVVASLVGVVTGTPVMRDGTGPPMAPATALAVSVGAFLLFGGAGLAMPRIGRKIAAGHPDQLIAFVAAATSGALNSDATHAHER